MCSQICYIGGVKLQMRQLRAVRRLLFAERHSTPTLQASMFYVSAAKNIMIYRVFTVSHLGLNTAYSTTQFSTRSLKNRK
jgi:hypothetical protein